MTEATSDDPRCPLFRLLRPFAAAALLSLALAVPGHAEDATPLVSTGWLKQHLKDPDVLVLDVRSAIDGGGVEAYQKGHIPGAIHSDYDKAGWRVTRGGVPFMLPTLAELEKLIGETRHRRGHACGRRAGRRAFHGFRLGGAHLLDLEGRGRLQGFDPRRRLRGLGGRAERRSRPAPSKPSPKIFTATLNKSLFVDAREVRGDRTRRRRDAGRRAARVVLRRQGEGAGRARPMGTFRAP